jgi:hypothetical protein
MEKNHQKIIILGILFVSLIAMSSVHAESAYDQNAFILNYSGYAQGSQTVANLVVQVLKYEKYPVTAGDWFDVWIEVQNIGQNDAPHAVFELQPEYPFSSNDSLIRDYGIIKGRVNSYKVDQKYDSTDVILKYRVKAADNAPTGTSDLKLKITPDVNDPSSSSTTASLPIEIFSPEEQQTLANTSLPENPYVKWAYGIVGLLSGAFVIVLLMQIKHKVVSSKHSH